MLAIGLLLFFPGIVIRLFHLQIIAHPSYAQEATRNLERYHPIPPNRGAIRDCNGNLLVKTAPAYHIRIQLAKITEESQKNLSELLEIPLSEIQVGVQKYRQSCDKKIHEALAQEFQISKEEYRLYLEKFRDEPAKLAEALLESHKISPKLFLKSYARIKRDYYNRADKFWKVTREEAIKLELQKCAWRNLDYKIAMVEDRFPGFEVGHTVSREYPYGEMLVQLLGRLGSISPEQYRCREKDYQQSDIVGQEGLEQIYEDKLRGQRGCQVSSFQGEDFSEFPRQGMDIILTIDAGAQKVAEEALDTMIAATSGATGGAAVVIEAATGEIKVLATNPRYRNETYSENFNQLLADPTRPLENRAITNSYPPPQGSVFKVMVAIYALHHGFTTPYRKIECTGTLEKDATFECTHVHSEVNLVKAIGGSCNVYFYTLGEEMGPERLEECALLFGFGQKCLGFPRELPGLIPTLKRRATNRPWYPGESRIFAIGQLMEVTPLQVAQAMAMIANRGVMPRVHLIKAIRVSDFSQPEEDEISLLGFSQPVRKWTTKDEYWDVIYQGMNMAVEGSYPYATAASLRSSLNVRIAAKTGTAEIGKDPETGKSIKHAWFAGFFPLESPRYAFAVFIERGGYGAEIAGPVAVEIINYFYH